MNDVKRAVTDCDANGNGEISKDELNAWLVKFMKENAKLKEENKMVLQKKLSLRKE